MILDSIISCLETKKEEITDAILIASSTGKHAIIAASNPTIIKSAMITEDVAILNAL